MKEGFILMKNDFLSSIKNINNIYDFTIMLFLQVDENGRAQADKEYLQFLNKKHELAKQISTLFEQLLSGNINTEFNDWIECWISLVSKMDAELSVLCYHTLKLIDNYFSDLVPQKMTTQNRGPFVFNEKYALYFTPPKPFFSDYFNKNKIRDGRQKNIYDENSINCSFKSFMVINLEICGRYKPVITSYNVRGFCHDIIGIGLSPINCKPWFNVDKDFALKQFSIEYDNTKEQDHNNNIISTIRECSNKDLHFFILPELAMNKKTEETLMKQIICDNVGVPKLLFLGSHWGETNEATLMTNSGTIVFKQKKSVPYKPFIKGENEELVEPLQKNDTINFVDITGVGRIAYLICADLKDESVKMICKIMRTDFIIISSYTNQLGILETNAQSLASTNGVTTIICNSCAAITDDSNIKEKICAVFVPKAEGKKLIANDLFSFDKSSCSKSTCCKCIKHFSINKNLS